MFFLAHEAMRTSSDIGSPHPVGLNATEKKTSNPERKIKVNYIFKVIYRHYIGIVLVYIDKTRFDS